MIALTQITKTEIFAFKAVLVFKVGLSPSKNIYFYLLQFALMMKNALYFILKALFVLKMFKFLS